MMYARAALIHDRLYRYMLQVEPSPVVKMTFVKPKRAVSTSTIPGTSSTIGPHEHPKLDRNRLFSSIHNVIPGACFCQD